MYKWDQVNGWVKEKEIPFPYGLCHITPLLRFLCPQRRECSIFTLLPCVHGESLGIILKCLPWDVCELLHGNMLGSLRMESVKVCNGFLAISQVGHWFPRVIAWPMWWTRAMLMGVFVSLFKVCFLFIYRYECFKTLSYTFIYFLLLLLYCYFTSFYLDYSDRSAS